jgi:exosortase/archaeosortase family protein
MIAQQIKKIRQTVPHSIIRFFVRGILLTLAWNLLYHLILKPAMIPDNQLTAFIEWGTVKMLSLFTPDVYGVGKSVFIGKVQCVNIDPQCNGLELIVMYIGFLFCLPSNKWKMLAYAIVGTLVICILNMMRCAALAWMYLHTARSIVDFAHHFAFKLIIYAVVFCGWLLYSKNYVWKTV